MIRVRYTWMYAAAGALGGVLVHYVHGWPRWVIPALMFVTGVTLLLWRR